MKDLQIFNFRHSEVRIVMIEKEPWWVLVDLCKILGLDNPTMSLKALRDKEHTKFNLGSLSG